MPARRIAVKSQVFVYDHTNGAASGFGMMNASRVNAATVGLVIRDAAGQVIQTSTLNLAPGAHSSFSLLDQFQVTRGQRGTVEFAPQPGGWFAVIGLHFNATGPVTSIDVMEP